MTNSSSDRPGEFELIAQIFAPLATSPGAFGLTDDAAVVTPPAGHDLVATTDALVEGVHFFGDDPPDLIARKALRVNLSDLAAKGCAPLGYLLSLSIPTRVRLDWLQAFASGLAQDQGEFDISLIGGDTTATPGPISIAVTAFGHLPSGTMLRRLGAKVGDLVFVSGMIGDAGGGQRCLSGEGLTLSNEDRAFLIGRYHLPEPRLALGQALRNVASASIDVSDGLLADLGHVAKASGKRIVVEAAKVPVSRAMSAMHPQDTIVFAASAGDDYEIVFTVPPERCRAMVRIGEAQGVAISHIGRVVRGSGVALLDGSGGEIPVVRRGFTHF